MFRTQLTLLVAVATATITHDVLADTPGSKLCDCRTNLPYEDFHECMLACPDGVYFENVGYTAPSDLCQAADGSLFVPLPKTLEKIYFIGGSFPTTTTKCSSVTVQSGAGVNASQPGCPGWELNAASGVASATWAISGRIVDQGQPAGIYQAKVSVPFDVEGDRWLKIHADCTPLVDPVTYSQLATAFLQNNGGKTHAAAAGLLAALLFHLTL